MGSSPDNNKELINNCKNLAVQIIQKLEDEDVRKKLNTICMLEKLPDLSDNEEIRDLKDYRQLKEILKTLYISTARTIMAILNTKESFSSDPANSFNYTEPLEPMLAAEYIKLLPNAYIAGPMKAAVSHPHIKVKKIAIGYYDTLPADFKSSGIFPPNFNKIVREIKSQIKD